MPIRYVLTITGASSVEEALTFYCDQVSADYGSKACRYVVSKGFKRTLLAQPTIKEHIERRFSEMHQMSASEFVWFGHDENGNSTYVVYGLFGEDMAGSKEPAI